jgi:Flp pilus assembly pilin Flp
MSEYAFVLMVISAATVALFSSFSDGVANEVSNVARLFP